MASPAVVPQTLPANFQGWDKSNNAPPAVLPADFQGWDKPPAEQPSDTRNGFQRGVDALTETEPANKRPGIAGHVETALGNIGAGLMSPLGLVAHPIAAGKSVLKTAANPYDPEGIPGQMIQGAIKNPVGTLETLPGQVALGGAAGLAKEGLGAAGSSLREAAMEVPEKAALRGLQVGPKSPSSLQTLSSYQGARPFLQGAQNLADVQARIPGVKNEIWSPYKQAIDEIGPRSVQGPDGLTTIKDLENERLQLSALNRGLRTRDPQAVQLAEQKGLNQAQLLDRERTVKAALDPELQKVGIQPQEIRKAFGQVSNIEGLTAGKSTLLENSPYGFGRMKNIRITKPSSYLGEPIQGLKDIAAGRPLWSGSPTDVNLREAFRVGGEKPNFGQVIPQNRLQLPAQVPFREGEEPGGPWQFGVPTGGQVTPAPRAFPALTAKAGEGETQPMIGTRLNRPAEVESPFRKERILPTRFTKPMEAGSISGPVTPHGQVRPIRGLLQAPFDVPADNSTRIYPPGSQHRDFDEQIYYPKGSKFQPKGKNP